ncbi:trypco2 family protein [Streptomyces sp. FxanaA7]|uniref:trypco2 family protein n=1 Tax=Streptomyces sp. FxanaA7 TaxID=1265492 RepID=UPI0005EDAE49|nr:trypco2 family protein [Streptomyces sp. FxanaA7]
MAGHEEQWVELSEVVRQPSGQLHQATPDDKGNGNQCKLGRVVLEFEVDISKERGADGEPKAGVLCLGAKGSQPHGTNKPRMMTHTLQDRQGCPARISGTQCALPTGCPGR